MKKKTIRGCFYAVGSFFLALSAQAALQVTFQEPDAEPCLVEDMKPVFDPKLPRQQALVNEYQANPDAFGLVLDEFKGLIAGHRYWPLETWAMVKFKGFDPLSRRIREYTASTTTGETFKFDDGTFAMELCRKKETIDKDDCIYVSHLEVMCSMPYRGQAGRAIVMNALNGKSSLPQVHIQQAIALSAEELQVQRKQEAQQKAAVAQVRAAHAAIDKQLSAAREREAVAAIEAGTLHLKDAPVGSVLFCASVGLLAQGDLLTQLSFRCDQLGRTTWNVREFFNHGWDVASELRTPETNMAGGVSHSVSLRLRKVR